MQLEQLAGLVVLILATLAAALYAHYRVPYHTTTQGHRWFVHLLLAVLGLAFGWVMSSRFGAAGVTGISQWLVFLSAFGVVHVPAAGILFIKRQRHEWR